MVYNTIQHPPTPHPHSHTLSVLNVHLVWEGGEVREKVEGHKLDVLVVRRQRRWWRLGVLHLVVGFVLCVGRSPLVGIKHYN
jgi:hypothetical protein